MLSLVVTVVPNALAQSSVIKASSASKSTTAQSTTTATTSGMPVRDHGVFLLSEVYEVEPGNYGPCNDESNPDHISPNQCFRGSKQTVENVRVVPGILCLDTNENF